MRYVRAARFLPGTAFIMWMTAWVGCTAANPVGKWQASVDRYVAEAGGGDPQVLRCVAGSDPSKVDRRGLITFNRLALRAGWLTKRTYDVFGALLEVIPLDDGRGYLFVVAVARRGRPTGSTPIPPARIRDVRLAMLHVPPRSERWQVSPAAPEATEQYKAARTASDALARPFFPAPGDQFEYQTTGGRLIVTERRSGARWELSLASRAREERG
jgi:hypothetical protein